MQFVCTVCMQAMTHSVDNVPIQQAVKLVVVGLGFVEQCWLDCFGETSLMKNGVNWGNRFEVGEPTLKIIP